MDTRADNPALIATALDNFAELLGAEVGPFAHAVMHVSSTDERKQIIEGVMGLMLDITGRFLGTLQFAGILVEGEDFTTVIHASRDEHCAKLAAREKELRDAEGVRADA